MYFFNVNNNFECLYNLTTLLIDNLINRALVCLLTVDQSIVGKDIY